MAFKGLPRSADFRIRRARLPVARPGLVRCPLSIGILGAITLWLMAMAGFAYGQTQSQIQYVYDAAGNLIQITRSAQTSQPDLTVTNLSVGIVSAVGNGSFSIPVTFQVNNMGSSSAVATWYDRGYLSANGVLHDSDQVLTGYNTRAVSLAAGTSYSVSLTFTTTTSTSPGNYFLIVKADGGNATGQYSPTGANYVSEFNEFNNAQSVAITLPANPKPDLTASNASTGAITVNQSGSYSFPVTYQINNVGNIAASGNWSDTAYLSADAVLDNSDLNLGGYHTQTTALASGASYTVTTTFNTTVATGPGTYTLFIKADGRGATLGGGTNTDNGFIVESNEANNTQALSLTLPIKPDLTVSNASIGAITVNQSGSYSFPVTYTITNNGGSSARANWTDTAYLSSDATLDNSDLNLGGYHTQTTALASGASYTVTTTFNTTLATGPGTYTLFIKADGRGATIGGGTNTDNGLVAESNETNNTQALSLTLPIKPDLTVSNASIGAITVNQSGSYSFPVTYTITNNGGATALANWTDTAYLSSDATLDNSDLNLGGYHTQTTALASGASYTVTTTFNTTLATGPGTYTLFIKADGRGATIGGGTNTDNGLVAESNETNNTQALSLTLPIKPDLTVSIVSIGTIVKNGNGSHSIPVTYTITNNGGASARATWYDLAYLSVDATLDNGDQSLSGYHTQTAALAAGANYTVNGTFITTTATPAGTYTLFVKADGRGSILGGGSNTDSGLVAESSEGNNTASLTVVLQ